LASRQETAPTQGREKNKNINKLKVFLVLQHTIVPTWLRTLLRGLNELNDVSLSVVVLSDQESPYSKGHVLFRLWKALDHRLFRNKVSDAQQSEVLVDIRQFPAIDEHFNIETLTLEELGAVKTASAPDVIIWTAFVRPPEALLGRAPFGVWTLQNAVSPATGFSELVNKEPVTACTLSRLAADAGKDQVLAQAFAPTDQLSLARSLAVVRAKDQTLIMSMLRRVHRSGAEPESTGVSMPRVVNPGVAEFLLGVARLYSRYIIDLAKRPFYFRQWQLAYSASGERLSQDNMTRLAPGHKGFWADPFVLKRNGGTYIFFEEMPEGESRGRIVCVEITADGRASKPRTVLEREFHLSYPFLFEYDDGLFMIPESGAAERIEVFRCVSFPDKWESHAVILEGVRAFDPTIIEVDGLWWMFATIQHNGNSTDDELHLFYSDDPFGNWRSHPNNPVSVDVRSARPAGALYWEDGALIRPAQDCSVRYGYALSIQKILRMNTLEYEEETVNQVLPDWAPNGVGTHTLNHVDGFTVYDCQIQCRK
jgi:hypothetical protein